MPPLPQAGRLLSNARPVLVVDDPGVAAEVAMLGDVQAALPERVAAALTDLGLLLALRSASEARAAGEVAGRGGGGDQEDASSEVVGGLLARTDRWQSSLTGVLIFELSCCPA